MTADVPQRPMRADARRNYDKIVAVARDVFSECGVEAPLDDIARRANVGPGTLYRHFPNRDALVVAVYREVVEELSTQAHAFVEKYPPWEALDRWLGELVEFVTHKNGLAATLKAALDKDSPTYSYCKTSLRAAAAAVLTPAQEVGEARPDIRPEDLLRLGHGVGVVSEHVTKEDAARLMSVLIDGLRVMPPDTARESPPAESARA